MASITINISDDRYQILQYMAKENGVSLEDLLRASVDDWLTHQQSDFSQATKYVLAKNAELYQRLA